MDQKSNCNDEKVQEIHETLKATLTPQQYIKLLELMLSTVEEVNKVG